MNISKLPKQTVTDKSKHDFFKLRDRVGDDKFSFNIYDPNLRYNTTLMGACWIRFANDSDNWLRLLKVRLAVNLAPLIPGRDMSDILSLA